MNKVWDLKMRYAIGDLMDDGTPEDIATIIVCLKNNKKELAEGLIKEVREKQHQQREEVEKFIRKKLNKFISYDFDEEITIKIKGKNILVHYDEMDLKKNMILIPF